MGVVLPTGAARWGEQTDPGRLIEFARRAEALGFHSLWAGDTLLRPIIETFTMLSAAAAVTERVTLGTAALLPALRRPVQAAQVIASLDLLSGGRLALTVGAGFPRRSEAEYAVSEVPWRGRFARLDDTVALWRHLWTSGGPTSFHGKVLRFDDIPESTRPAQPGGPPIWLGGATPAALARAGRLYDGWLPYPPDPADYGAGLTQVRRPGRLSGDTGAVRDCARRRRHRGGPPCPRRLHPRDVPDALGGRGVHPAARCRSGRVRHRQA